MRDTKFKTLMSVAITIVFLIYLYLNRVFILKSLEGIKLRFLLIILLAQFFLQLSNSIILSATLSPLGVLLKPFESLKVTLVSSFVNFFTPVVGGASTKAVYLKSKHGLPFSAYIGALYANYIIMFLVSFTFGFVGVFLIKGAIESNVGLTTILFFTSGILLSILFVTSGHKIIKLINKLSFKNTLADKFIQKIKLVDDGWASIRQNKRKITIICFWSVSAVASLTVIYWAAIASIGLKTNLGISMIFAALASVSLLFNLTPGSIGVRETLYASVFKITRIGARAVVAFSLVDRAVQLTVIGIGWVLFGNSVIKAIGKNTAITKSIGTKD